MWRATFVLGLAATLAIGCDQMGTVGTEPEVSDEASRKAQPVQNEYPIAGTQRLVVDFDLDNDLVSVDEHNILRAEGVPSLSVIDAKTPVGIFRADGRGDAYVKLDLNTGDGTLRVKDMHACIWDAELGGFQGTVVLTIKAWQINGFFEREGRGRFEGCTMSGSLTGYWGDDILKPDPLSVGPGTMRLEGTIVR